MVFDPERRSRDGAGTVLVVAALFILVLACMQVAQSFFLSQVSDQTTRSTVGRLAGLHAESAIEEAHLLMARRADDPRDPLFNTLREAGATAAGPHDIDEVRLALSDLPHTRAMLAAEAGKGFDLADQVTCKLRYVRPLVPLYPVEYEGIATYKARVRWKHDRTIVREIEETQSFKVGHQALPPPLATYPLIIRHPEPEVFGHAAGDPSTRIGVDVNDLIARLNLQTVKAIHDQYEEMKRLLGQGGSSSFARQVRGYYERLENDSGLNHFQECARLKGLIVPFPPLTPGKPYFLVCVTTTADLANLNLQYQLARRLQLLDGVIDRLGDLGRRTRDGFQAQDQSPAAARNNELYSNALLEALRLIEQVMTQVVYFQQCVKWVEPTAGAGYDRLRYLFALLDPAQMASTPNLVSLRSFYCLGEQPPGPGRLTVDDQWKRLKERLGRATGLAGFVYVDNPDETLTLAGELPGLVTIAVRGPLVIDGLRAKQPASDVLTVIAMGGATGRVAIRGSVVASIVTRCAAVGIEPGTRITGSLVMDEVTLNKQELFTGSVQVDPRLADTARPPFLYVSFSPWTRSRTTVRS